MLCLALLNPGSRFLVLLQLETSKSGCACLPLLNRPFSLPSKAHPLLEAFAAGNPQKSSEAGHPLTGAFAPGNPRKWTPMPAFFEHTFFCSPAACPHVKPNALNPVENMHSWILAAPRMLTIQNRLDTYAPVYAIYIIRLQYYLKYPPPYRCYCCYSCGTNIKTLSNKVVAGRFATHDENGGLMTVHA